MNILVIGCGCGGVVEAGVIGGVAGVALGMILLRAYLLHAIVCTKHVICMSLKWFSKDRAK